MLPCVVMVEAGVMVALSSQGHCTVGTGQHLLEKASSVVYLSVARGFSVTPHTPGMSCWSRHGVGDLASGLLGHKSCDSLGPALSGDNMLVSVQWVWIHGLGQALPLLLLAVCSLFSSGCRLSEQAHSFCRFETGSLCAGLAVLAFSL